MQKEIHIGIIGMGLMGRLHLQKYNTFPDVSVVAIADTNRDHLDGRWVDTTGTSGTDAKETLCLDQVIRYSDMANLLADNSIDAVDICLPTDLHYDVTMKALRNGKDVIVEKPIATSPDLAQEMISEAQKYGRVLMVAHPLRFWSVYTQLAEIVKKEEYGRVFNAQLSRQCATPLWSSDLWSLDNRRSGGILLDMQIHDLEYVISLFGLPDTCCSHSGSRNRNQFGCSLLQYPDFQVPINSYWIDSPAYPFKSWAHFLFERANVTLSVSDTEEKVVVYTPKGASTQPLVPRDPYQEELAYFVLCVRERVDPVKCPPDVARDAVRLSQKLSLSALNDGKIVPC
ncbi:Gfo/Idh/MocA family oxidoreductase [Candidatus Peregrinibacteria bacterium]|nr:Gfo/Idh/MocA family oxidoreductase [Candidatus Peregrinibacteria bacterium]